MNEQEVREQMVVLGKSLFDRGYTCGSSGNLSVRLDDGILVTPTASCLGRLASSRIAKISSSGERLSGDPPSKEAFLHLAVYRARPADRAVVHLHSTHAVAVSCLDDLPADDVLPAVTPYYVMRIGRLPRIPYFAPGDSSVAAEIERYAEHNCAMLLANHGPVVTGTSLQAAVDAAEELEETAKLYLMLRSLPFCCLTSDQVMTLRKRFSR